MDKVSHFEGDHIKPAPTISTSAFGADEHLFLGGGVISNPRQQRKIISGLKNPDIITQPDAVVSKHKMKSFLQQVFKKEITDKRKLEKEFQQFILRIDGNLPRIKLLPLFKKMRTDKRLIGILAYFTLGSLYRRNQIRANDILDFLKKFPDPYTFQYQAKDFLDMIALFNSPDKRREYEESMRTFMELIYGKQFEYFIQINLLRSEAQHLFLKSISQCQEDLGTFSLDPIGNEEAEKILGCTDIQGSMFRGLVLTPVILKMKGLQPRFKMSLMGVEKACFSTVYSLGQGRIAVVAYIKRGGRYVTVSYYLSNSHGIWRYLDGYYMMDGKIISYGKKGKQDSVNLALVFQKALAEITNNNNTLLNPDQWSSELIFAGSTYNALYLTDTAEGTAGAKLKKAIHTPYLPHLPQKLSGNFYPAKGERIQPEALRFYNPYQAPDFSKAITGWHAANETYGQITYEAFLSKNGQFIYTFCRDERERIWLGSIENHSKIQPGGVREIWVDGGDLTTPAFEYDIKAGDYGNMELRSGNYIDMSKNYLSKIWIALPQPCGARSR